MAAVTRNARLAAIRSLFSYLATRCPEHAADIARVLSIPAKRYNSTIITYLSEPEVTVQRVRPAARSGAGRGR